ncbi:Rho GDP-dissociation inhibitor, partial [Tremellales sp. Uapishka_1]
MSHAHEATEDDLAPTQTEGYKEDESLQRWKMSLGLGPTAGGGSKKVVLKTLFLSSPTLDNPISVDLTQSPAELARLKKEMIIIKEGVEYSVGITFVVENEIVSGLKYLQVVKRSGLKVDKTEAMLGSYGPQDAVYTKVFASEESPSGLLARSGSYVVRSRVVDDDNHVWLDFEWGFKLAKEW